MGTAHHDICQGCPNRPELRSAAQQIGIREQRIARIREQQRAIKQSSIVEQIGSLGRRLSLYVELAKAEGEIRAVHALVNGELASSDASNCSGLLERSVPVDTLADGEVLYKRETLCGVRAKLDELSYVEVKEEGWSAANPTPIIRLDIPSDY